MRKLMIVLLALATALAIAAPAAAKKPDNPGKPGGDEPLAGTTCVRPPSLVTTDFISFELSEGGPEDACFDVLTTLAGVWHATVTPVTPDARVRTMTIVPRDAYAPGDSCGGEGRRGWDAIQAPWEFPHPDDPRFDVIPAATVNACPGDDPGGVGQFAETLDTFDDEGNLVFSEAVMDPDPDTPHPLAFLVFTQGLRGTVRIDVDLP